MLNHGLTYPANLPLGNVTIYGQTTFHSNADLDTHKQYFLAFGHTFITTPIVLMSAATYCVPTHPAGDVHMLSHAENGNGVQTDGFAIKSYQKHDGPVFVNWMATGRLEGNYMQGN